MVEKYVKYQKWLQKKKGIINKWAENKHQQRVKKPEHTSAQTQIHIFFFPFTEQDL